MAEVAALLAVPLGVARVLLSDLAELGTVVVNEIGMSHSMAVASAVPRGPASVPDSHESIAKTRIVRPSTVSGTRASPASVIVGARRRLPSSAGGAEPGGVV